MNEFPVEIEIRAYRNPTQAFALELYGFNREHSHAATALIMVEKPSGIRMDPFVSLNQSEAQVLADSLYDAGIRPSQMAVKKDEDAVLRHLEDMRKIAFGWLEACEYGTQGK